MGSCAQGECTDRATRYDAVRHYGYLDGVRGAAVLLVIFSHTSNEKAHVIPGLSLSGAGKLGVWLFFTLSAFLLCARLIDMFRLDRPGWRVIASYGAGRVARIFPLYIVVILVYWFFGRVEAGEVAPHLLLLEGKSIFWAIPVEFKFYALLPLIAYALSRLSPAPATMAVLVLFVNVLLTVMFPLKDYPPNTLSFLPYVSIFLWGVLAAHCAQAGILKPPRRMSSIILIICLVLTLPTAGNFVLLILGGAALPASEFHFLGPLQGLLSSLLILHGLTVPWLRRGFENRVVMYTGKISFSMYLWHILLLEKALQATWLPLGLKGIATLTVSFILSVATYALIEKPGISFGHRLGARILAGGEVVKPEMARAAPGPEPS